MLTVCSREESASDVEEWASLFWLCKWQHGMWVWGKMLPVLNCRCVIPLNVWSAWPHCCVLRYSIRRALKVCVLYLYYFLSPEEIFFFFLLLILAGNAKDLESILLFGKSDFLSSRKSECFRFVTLKTWKIELCIPFNRKKKWLSLPRGIQNI